ncbi:hypothetical protein BD779DRAFT_1465716 [Infundibulicybe gibba]|nr:hypothetical protein BD779DRAFT_1465716 [Infundibulicybe gibba]
MYRDAFCNTTTRSPPLSFRSVRARCPESFSAPTSPMDKSLRLVQDTKLPEMLLPLSPKLPGPALLPYLPGSPLSLACTYPANKPSPPQHFLPFIPLEYSQPPAPPSRIHPDGTAPKPLKISRPRPLARRRGEESLEPSITAQDGISCTTLSDNSPISTPLHSTKPVATQGTNPENVNLVPVLRSPEPLNIKTVSTQRKNIPRKTSRPRKSPAIGPSPLRAMVLPDSSETNLVSSFETGIDNQEIIDSSDRVSAHSVYAQLGLGFPARRRRESLTTTEDGKASFEAPVHDDADILLNIIRDLVEETSEWDANLFVDENFKSMMQGSWVTPVAKGQAITADPNYTERSKADDSEIHPAYEHELATNISKFVIPLLYKSIADNDTAALVWLVSSFH